MSRSRIDDALVRLARAEMAFLGNEFVAQAVRAGGVEITIDGVRHTMRVVPADFEGWGLFRPLSRNVAMLVREATLTERRQAPSSATPATR